MSATKATEEVPRHQQNANSEKGRLMNTKKRQEVHPHGLARRWVHVIGDLDGSISAVGGDFTRDCDELAAADDGCGKVAKDDL